MKNNITAEEVYEKIIEKTPFGVGTYGGGMTHITYQTKLNEEKLSQLLADILNKLDEKTKIKTKPFIVPWNFQTAPDFVIINGVRYVRETLPPPKKPLKNKK